MRRLLLALSLTALLFGVVTTSAQTAKPGLSVTRVNFGKVQAGTVYTADLIIKNNTGEDITGAAPVFGDSLFSIPNWTCGTITSTDTTCTTQVQFYTDFALVSGSNRISRSVTLSYVGATTESTYTATVTLAATQTAQK